MANLPLPVSWSSDYFSFLYWDCRSHDEDGTGQHSCDLDPMVNVKGQIMYFLLNASHYNFKLCRCISHIMKSVQGNILCDLGLKIKGDIIFLQMHLFLNRLMYEGRSICNENSPVNPKVLYLYTS